MSTMDMKQSSHPAHNIPGSKYAGDVIPHPASSRIVDENRLRGEVESKAKSGITSPGVARFDPGGDMTGGGKVVKGPGYTE